ncbi:hypothetical protein JXD38_04640 [candidate division WOR-3 bacterium]|nr:hypothetical protein [candidate division WOR-3 bacterium]
MKVAALALIACLLSPALASGPDTLWVRRLDVGSDEFGNDIASNGNAIAVAGDAFGSISDDWLVARMNQSGETAWTRTYDAGGDERAVCACLDRESNVLAAGMGYVFKGTRGAGSPYAPGRSRLLNPRSPLQGEYCALTAKYDSLGTLRWFRSDTGYVACGIVADSAGNVFMTGAHITSDTTWDFWLAKSSPTGETLWTVTYDFARFEVGYRPALDAAGNIAVPIYAGDSLFHCITAKFTPDGHTIWSRKYEPGTDDAGTGLAIDPSGNIIVAGRTASDTTTEGFVLKYDPSGTLLWSKIFTFSQNDALADAACDSAGDIFVAGYTSLGYNSNCLLVKLDSLGDTLWTATYGGSAYAGAAGVTCDPLGNPVIVGTQQDTLTYNSDILAIKYAALTGIAESPRSAPTYASAHTITAGPDFILSVPCSGSYDVRLCDLTGRTRQQLFHGTLAKGAHRLSVSAVPAGTYFVRVAASDGGISCHRFVLVK